MCSRTLVVLKVTHHGFNTSSTPLFLNSFKPEIAVIQVGADNSYGHPIPQTLERLQKTSTQVFRNDEHGDVIVTSDGEKADVAVTKGGLQGGCEDYTQGLYLRSGEAFVDLPYESTSKGVVNGQLQQGGPRR